MTRARCPALLALATVACIETAVGPDPEVSPSGLFDLVWSDFDRHYASFEVRHIDWDAVRSRFVAEAAAATSVNAVAPVIGAMFRELRDPHVDLLLPGRRFYSSVDLGSVATHFDVNAVLARYVSTARISPSRNIRSGLLSSDIGWIRISSFASTGWTAEFDDALVRLGDIKGLVVDVRDNGGGSTNNSEAIAARFYDQPRIFGYVQYRNGPRHDDFTERRALVLSPAGVTYSGRVVVLTNRRCVSTTESFILSMKVLPGVQMVGDTTAGGLGNPLIRELPNGWVYRLPQWIQLDAAYRAFEGQGIPPDVFVSMTAADSVEGRDRQLERAIEILRGS